MPRDRRLISCWCECNQTTSDSGWTQYQTKKSANIIVKIIPVFSTRGEIGVTKPEPDQSGIKSSGEFVTRGSWLEHREHGSFYWAGFK